MRFHAFVKGDVLKDVEACLDKAFDKVFLNFAVWP